jgi:hypothetical protein
MKIWKSQLPILSTLEKVINFYDKGGGVGIGLNLPQQTLSYTPLNLTKEEKTDLISFIEALTSLRNLNLLLIIYCVLHLLQKNISYSAQQITYTIFDNNSKETFRLTIDEGGVLKINHAKETKIEIMK